MNTPASAPLHATFLDFGTLGSGLDTSSLEHAAPGIVLHARTSPADVPSRMADAEVVLLNKVQVTAAHIAGAPHLKFIGLAATGTNNVDLEAARARGIAVCNIRDYCTASVAQHVWGVILALTHKLREYDDALKAGEWQRAEHFSMLKYPVRELAGLTLGLVGHGTLAGGVERIAQAFGMRVIVAQRQGTPGAPPPGRVSLDELLATADIISLHCPLNVHTQGFIGAPQLARMKRDALLVNTARGALIDPEALATALRAGTIGGAAIDVLAEEPPVNGNPLLAADIPNLLVTPHTAWAAVEARQRALDQLAGHLAAWRRGEASGRVV